MMMMIIGMRTIFYKSIEYSYQKDTSGVDLLEPYSKEQSMRPQIPDADNQFLKSTCWMAQVEGGYQEFCPFHFDQGEVNENQYLSIFGRCVNIHNMRERRRRFNGEMVVEGF